MSKRFILAGQLAKASVATYLKQAKACFNWAVKQEWIEKSPLAGIGVGSFVNKSKDRKISMDEYQRLLDACPCQDWRVIISLARIGGLRCPSEVIALKWSDVEWKKNRFFVRSPKTEHHEGKESRIVPIFPELKTELETLFSMPQSKGREFVINRHRDPDRNLGSPFNKISKEAGLVIIPRPFDNMRATRSKAATPTEQIFVQDMQKYMTWGSNLHLEMDAIAHQSLPDPRTELKAHIVAETARDRAMMENLFGEMGFSPCDLFQFTNGDCQPFV